jgi:hypothetical protein
VVSVTQSPDDRDPKLVVANGGRAGPTAAICYRVPGHVRSFKASADLLAAGADKTLADAPTVTAG